MAAGVDLVEFDVLALARGDRHRALGDLHELSHGAEAWRRRLDDAGRPSHALPTATHAALARPLRFFAEEAPRVGVHVDLKSPSASQRSRTGLRGSG